MRLYTDTLAIIPTVYYTVLSSADTLTKFLKLKVLIIHGIPNAFYFYVMDYGVAFLTFATFNNSDTCITVNFTRPAQSVSYP